MTYKTVLATAFFAAFTASSAMAKVDGRSQLLSVFLEELFAQAA